MKVLVILLSITTFVSTGTVPDYSKFNPVYGYLTKFGIPEAERIQKAEEAYLNSLKSSRILGGSPAAPAQIAYQAGLISDIVGTTGRGICGASLLNDRRLVTAAHCWHDGRHIAWRFTVVLGSNLLFSGGTRITTSAVVTHPDWFPWLIRNDIAIIYLLTPVRLSASIAPIALPSGRQLTETFADSQATVSGFGLIDNATTISENQFLSYVRVLVVPNNICSVAYPTMIQENHICTSTTRGAGPSQGDSGGPLVTEHGGRIILIGLTSFGSALPLSLPSVYTRITSFINFINENLV